MTLRFKGYMSSDISKCQKIHFSSFHVHSIVNQTRRYVIMDISMMSFFFYYKHDMISKTKRKISQHYERGKE